MKTVTQIKDNLAKEQGYPSYQEYLEEINGNFYCAERLEKFYDEVIRRTAKEALKNASENSTYYLDANDEVHIVKSSITSEENTPTL